MSDPPAGIPPAGVRGYPFSYVPQDVAPVATKYRRIGTKLPVPESLETLQRLLRSEPRSMFADQMPILWHRAEGFQVHDPYGNTWIDLMAGTMVANIGHAHPKVVAAMRQQLELPCVNGYYFPSALRADLVEKLANLVPGLDRAFLLSTGTEATECALKLSRIWGRKQDPKKIGVISFTNAFHGKTLGAQMMGGRAAGKHWIGNLDPDIHFIPFPWPGQCPHVRDAAHECTGECFHRSIDGLTAAGVDLARICLIMLEGYQGWASLTYPPSYMQAVRAWSTKHNVLFAVDEVQSGWGRTGRFFAFEHCDVIPDLVCCGKGISNGVPLSAVLGSAALLDVDPSVNSTHSGNPLMCAAALATLEVMREERIPERAARLETVVRPRLEAIRARHQDRIAWCFGKGLAWSLIFVKPGTTDMDSTMPDRIIEYAARRGVLMLRTGFANIRVCPPLTIADEALIEALDVVAEAVDACC